METKKKKPQKIEKVTKPYLRGAAYDKTVLPGALKMFFGTLVMTLAFVMVGIVMSWDNAFLNIGINCMILFAAYLIFYQTGSSAGADAVNQGEIMYQRQEKGRPVAEWERQMCFHPAKGFLVGLLGSIPLVLASLVLALIAQRQTTSLGMLPSWVTPLETRPEIGNALAFYHETGSMTLEAGLRLVIRMSMMPFVNMVGATSKDGMLLLERISPLLNLIPGIVYGLGYLSGVQVRSMVHTNIALGKKKQKRKQAKERKARQTRKGPEQLN